MIPVRQFGQRAFLRDLDPHGQATSAIAAATSHLARWAKRFLLRPGIWLGGALGFAAAGWFGLWADYLGPTSRTVGIVAMTCLPMLAYSLWLPYKLARRLSGARRVASLSGRLIAADAVIPADAAAASWLANVAAGGALAAAGLLGPACMRLDDWLTGRFFWTPTSLFFLDVFVVALAWLPAALGVGPALAAGIAASTRPGGGGFAMHAGRLSLSAGIAMTLAALLCEVVSPQVWLLVAAAVPIGSALAGAAAVRPVMPPSRMPPLPSRAPYAAGRLLAGIAGWTFCLVGLAEALRRAVAFFTGAIGAVGPGVWAAMAVGLGCGLLLSEPLRRGRALTSSRTGPMMLAVSAAAALLCVLLTGLSRAGTAGSPSTVAIAYLATLAIFAVAGLTYRSVWEQFAARRSPSPGSACEFITAILLAAAVGIPVWAHWLIPRWNANVSMWAAMLGLLATGTATAVLADAEEPGSLKRVAVAAAALLTFAGIAGPWSAMHWAADPSTTRVDYACGSYFQGVRKYTQGTLSLQLPGVPSRPLPELLAARAGLVALVARRGPAGAALLADYLADKPVTGTAWRLTHVPIDQALARNVSGPQRSAGPLDRADWWTRIRCDLGRYDLILLHLPSLDRTVLRAIFSDSVLARLKALLIPGGWIGVGGPPPQDEDALPAAGEVLDRRTTPRLLVQQVISVDDAAGRTVLLLVRPEEASLAAGTIPAGP